MHLSTAETLQARAKGLLNRLAKIWRDDPTVLASFQADFESLLDRFEFGDLPGAHAFAELSRIYDEHLPSDSTKDVARFRNLDPFRAINSARGQFYIALPRGTLQAVNPPLSKDAEPPSKDNQYGWLLNTYGERGNRLLWLTYSRGRRQMF